MKILAAVLMTALFVFAVATAWVDYVQPQLDLIARASQQNLPVEREHVAKKKPRKVRIEPDEELLPVPQDTLTEADAEAPRKPSRRRAVVPHTEETRSLLNEQLAEVKERESRVADRQDSLRMMYDDIRMELAMLDEIRKRASEELIASERGKIEGSRRPLSSRVPAASAGGRTADTNGPVSFKKMSGNTTSRSYALIMKRLADDGREETAIAQLKAMKGRDAASVLDSLHSIAPRLAERLADSVPALGDAPVRQ